MVSKQQSGIALIQVLLITAILSVLVLYFTQTSRQQVKIAQYASIQAELISQLESIKNALVFELLTKPATQSYRGELLDIIESNLYGVPFAINQYTTCTIQDMAGLLPLHFASKERFIQILVANGIDTIRATYIFELLKDWQDLDTVTNTGASEESVYGYRLRNGYSDDVSDLNHLYQLTPSEYQIISQNYTTHFAGFFNPMLSPSHLLRAILPDSQYQQAMSLRQGGAIDIDTFSRVTTIKQDSELFFVPSNLIKLQLNVTKEGVTLNKTWIIQLDPEYISQKPVNYINIRG